jgi:hypothetical protein
LPLVIESAKGKEGEKVSKEHQYLTIVLLGHQGGSGGATRGHGWGATAKEFVGGHGEEDVLIVGFPDVEHTTRGVESEHRFFSFESDVRFLEIQVEVEAMTARGVRKERRETHAIGDREMIVDHGLLGVHEDRIRTEGKAIFVVDEHFVTSGEKIYGVDGLTLEDVP